MSPPPTVFPRHAIVALHGFGLTSDMWVPLQKLHPNLSWTTPTLPGHCGTPARSWQDTVSELVTDAPSHSVWLGYSLGGRLAIACALSDSTAKGLIVISSHAGLAAAERQKRQEWDSAMATSLATNPREFWQQWAKMPTLEVKRNVPREVIDTWRAMRGHHNPAQLSQAMMTLGQGSMPNYSADLQGSDLPTLFISGALDTKYTKLAASYTNIETATIGQAGHSLVLEAPEELASLIEEFANKALVSP